MKSKLGILILLILSTSFIFAQAEEVNKEASVSFQVIEEMPIFPGCENVEKINSKVCFQEKVMEHIKKNFKYQKKARQKNITGKVFVIFFIEKDGSIKVANVRGPHEILENEAKRIIELLPKMTPGKQKGIPVRMSMSIPISFSLSK